MAVDRGGLRYSIEVDDQFSEAFTTFVADTEEAEAAWKSFKATLASSNTASAIKAFKDLSDAIASTASNLVTLEEAGTEELSVMEESIATANSLAAAQKRLAAAGQLQLDNQARLLALEEDQNAALAQQTAQVGTLTKAYTALGAAQKGAQGGGGNVPTNPAAALAGAGGGNLNAAIGALKQVQNALSGINSFLDSITPKLNGFFTTLVGFAVVSKVVSGIKELISGIIDFNAELEKSQLGMAALFLATGDVRDAIGETVSPAQGLALAQQEALKQTKLLRQEALSTTATFDSLLKTFQTSIAPGLNAGLDVDQIRKFSVAITQAAGVIGVADDRIAHEVRDILAGTINNSRGDRIAKALGIDNQSINNAKQQGQLVEFLTQKFNAFAIAGEESLNTFDTILKNVKAAFDQVIGAGGLEFFQKIKDTLKGIFGFLTTKDSISGVLTPSPQAVAIIKTIADGLSDALDTIIQLVTQFGPGGLLSVAQLVADAIRIVAKIVAGIVDGLIQALPILKEVATFIRDAIKTALGVDIFDTKNLEQTVALLTKIGVLLGASLVATKGLAAAASFLTDAFADSSKLLKSFGPEALAAVGALGGLGASVGALGFLGFNQIKAFAADAGKAKDQFDLIKGTVTGFFTSDVVKPLDTAVISTNNLGERLKTLPGIVSATAEHAKDFDTTLEKIREDIAATSQQLEQETSLLGLSGNILKERQDLLKAEVDSRKQTRSIVAEETQAQALLNGLQQQRVDNAQEIAKLDDEDKDAVAKGIEAGQKFINDQREVALLNQKITDQTQQLNQARTAGNKEDITNLGASLKNLTEEKDALVKQTAADLNNATKLTDNEPLDAQKKINDLIVSGIALKGQEVVAQERLNSLKQDQLLIEGGLEAAAANRASLVAQQDSATVARNNIVLQAQAAAELATFGARNLLTDQQNLVSAQNKVNILTVQIAQEQQLRDLAIEQLKITRDLAQAKADVAHAAATSAVDPNVAKAFNADATAQLALAASLTRQIGLYQDQNIAKTQEEGVQLAAVTEELVHQQNIASAPFAQGLIDGFKQAAKAIPGLYQGIVDLVKGTITSFTSFVSESIVDAFDPTKDGTLQQRFAEFLQGIAKQVLNLFFQLAIQKAILGLGFLGTGGPVGAAGALGGLGFAEGGEIPHRRGKGMATGGGVRPTGLDNRDTIPIWAQAGEFMQPLSAVRQYGLDIMERLRRGMINPSALRAIAGIGGRRMAPVVTAGRQGFATGGQVGGSSSASPAAQITPAIIVSSDDNVERFLAGGKNALFKVLESDKKRLRSIVG